jgi:hypothetical protein
MLLDTCVLQHLRYLGQLMDGWNLADAHVDEIRSRHPDPLREELVALADVAALTSRNGPPWLVSETALLEFEKSVGPRAWPLIQWWWEWADYMFGCFDAEWYPGVDSRRLLQASGPDVHDRQLVLQLTDAPFSLNDASVPAFGHFRDAGDRALIRDAVRCGIPRILTTDIRSFWRHRSHVRCLGIEILRPTELWASVTPAYA